MITFSTLLDKATALVTRHLIESNLFTLTFTIMSKGKGWYFMKKDVAASGTGESRG